MNLFEQHRQQVAETESLLLPVCAPLLRRVLGEPHDWTGRLLRRAIQADQLSSIIFGPPGTSKTTLARIIANTTRAHFIAINAVLSG